MSEESEANQLDSVSGDTCSHAENSLRSVSAQVWIWPSQRLHLYLCVDPVEETKDPETVVLKPRISATLQPGVY